MRKSTDMEEATEITGATAITDEAGTKRVQSTNPVDISSFFGYRYTSAPQFAVEKGPSETSSAQDLPIAATDTVDMPTTRPSTDTTRIDSEGNTALHRAVFVNDQDRLENLISRGAVYLWKRNSNDLSAEEYAERLGRTECVAMIRAEIRRL
ncbi:hypothetical protein GQ53DRAFT_827855 [Thozetella sp. PMI_491]|nr:hypothetical protein GQ53DRAFT_827855 [Thozetella sp. PMI_491]